MNTTYLVDLPKDYYFVEKILDKKRFGRHIKYLVKWENYPLEQSSWEPLSNLKLVQEKIEEFEKKLKGITKGDLSLIQKNTKKAKKQKKKKVLIEKGIKSKFDSPETHCNNNRKIESVSFEIQNIDNEETIDNSFCNQSDSIPLGSLKNHTPIKILFAKQRNDGEILCLVEWKRNMKGIIPDPSYCTASELRKHYPDLLIYFYQSKINFNQL